jgi:succinyl-CoA:(S)-malate CoA-transferase subunit B
LKKPVAQCDQKITNQDFAVLTDSAIQPLDDIRILDVSSFLAGPFCSTQLAEFGAEVLKVELPKVGDPLRRFGTITENGDSLPWLSECRNKKSITLDMRLPEGAKILKRLVEKADVVVENFQPGTLEKWGLGWDTLKEVNPRLVMVRISGYGQTGPYRDRPGFGRIGNAFGGLSFLAGYPDRAPVTPGSATIPDYMAGLYGAMGVMLALRARERTGRGQMIDVGLYEPIFRILDELAPAYGYKGLVRQRMGPGTVNVVPHSHYPTKDGRWIAIACTNDKIYQRLAVAMNEPHLAEPENWGTLANRERNREAVDKHVADWTARYDRAEMLLMCEEAQVPCGPVYSIDEIFEDPQYAARGNILWMKDERVGELPIPNLVPRLSDTPGRVNWLGPSLGEHNDEVYKGMLGMAADEIKKLEAVGVI